MAKPGARTYFEMRLPFDGDPIETAILMAEADRWSDHHLLYECNQEIMLGLGSHANLMVYEDKAVLHTTDDQRSFPNEDFGTTVATALAQIDIADWRVYGVADFELSRHLFGLALADADRPLMRMFIPEAEARFTPGSVLLRALDPDTLDSLRADFNAAVDDRSGAALALRDRVEGPALEMTVVDSESKRQYEDMVTNAIKDITSHQYRKVILSRPVELPGQVDLPASYLKARAANTPARSYAVSLDGARAVGLSPETVVEVYDGKVFTTPLAGTRAMSNDVAETLRLREDLVSDAKEIAEHAISVYLSFDEMTMVCDPETVRVTEFMLVALRGTVQHLASRLQGELLDGCNPWHAFCALFPAVTASGVPKREAVDAIGRLEPAPRRLYSGCVFVADDNGMLDGALVLRTLFRNKEKTWLQAGAGIMNLSKPSREYEETCEKLGSFSNYLVTAGDRSAT